MNSLNEAALDSDPLQRYRLVQPLAEEIGRLCQQEIDRLGFDNQTVQLKQPGEAEFSLEKDPSNGVFTLVGKWLDQRGFKLGMLVFYNDGSFYIEQDVVRPHPARKRWFVEAINAWGNAEDIKVEAKLVPMPE
ncbi:MAG: hypothetical protein G8D59_14625 [gamma proteobacterium symbiont of Phacoides pectinatus]